MSMTIIETTTRLHTITTTAYHSRAGYKDTAGMIRQATKTRAIQKRLTTLIYFLSQELKSISEDSTKFALAKAQGLIKWRELVLLLLLLLLLLLQLLLLLLLLLLLQRPNEFHTESNCTLWCTIVPTIVYYTYIWKVFNNCGTHIYSAGPKVSKKY